MKTELWFTRQPKKGESYEDVAWVFVDFHPDGTFTQLDKTPTIVEIQLRIKELFLNQKEKS